MIAVVLLGSLIAFEAPPAGVDREAVKKLQGTWQLTTHEHGGKKSPAKEIANTTLFVSGQKIVTRDGVEVKEEGNLTLLDARTKPAAFDMKITSGTDRDKVVKGIWKIDGDELSVCVAEPARDRPTEFAGKEGTGHTYMVFKKGKK